MLCALSYASGHFTEATKELRENHFYCSGHGGGELLYLEFIIAGCRIGD